MPAIEARPETVWGFDRPVVRDWLFWVGVLIGVAYLVFWLPRQHPERAGFAFWWAAVGSIPAGVVLAGTVGGFFRQFVRHAGSK